MSIAEQTPLAFRPALAGATRPARAAAGAPAPAPHAVQALRLLDDAQEWSAFSRPSAGQTDVWESSVVLDGMYCAACAFALEDAIAAVPGVQRVRVSGSSHRAQVVWDARQVLPSVWMQAVQDIGYRANPANDLQVSTLRRAETRKALWRWLVAGLCMMQVMMYAFPAYSARSGGLSAEMEHLLRWASWVLSMPVLLFSCGPFFSGAWRELRQLRVGMDLPVALGLGITFAVSSLGTFEPNGPFGQAVYFDSFTMFVFFLLTGRWLELRLRDRTAGALEALMNRLPEGVERVAEDGSVDVLPLRRIQVGDRVRVQAGQAFAADGVVLQGSTHVDEALLTGEAQALPRGPGDPVIAGSYNLSASVVFQVQRVGAATRFAEIVALMESAALSKPAIAALADRLARPFLLMVLVCAALACAWWWQQGPEQALMVAVAVLVVTCPCALSLATPAALLAAAGQLARQGVLVRQLEALHAAAHVDTVVFDKTGTLTHDALQLAAITARPGQDAELALQMAAALARLSLHPASRALCAAAQSRSAPGAHWACDAVQESAGLGLSGQVRQPGAADAARSVRLGSAVFCAQPGEQERAQEAEGSTQYGFASAAANGNANGAGDLAANVSGSVAGKFAGERSSDGAPGSESSALQAPDSGTQVQLWDAQGWLATFALQETLRPDARATVAALQAQGLQVHLLSGDTPQAAERMAAQAGIPLAQGACTPADKLEKVRALQRAGRTVAVVGDGLNDGPVLAGAQVAFAFGQALPLAQSRADFVLPDGALLRVAKTLALARQTLRVVRQNLAWALVYNLACVPLAIMGFVPAWLAGLGMAASSLLVVLNALRLSGGGVTARALAPAPTSRQGV